MVPIDPYEPLCLLETGVGWEIYLSSSSSFPSSSFSSSSIAATFLIERPTVLFRTEHELSWFSEEKKKTQKKTRQ